MSFIFIYACNVSVHILRTCAHTFVYIICKQHGFMCIIFSATEMLSKFCIFTAGITEEPFKDFTTQIFSVLAQLHTFLIHNCSIMIYIYSLTSSSSENLHELLSSVIILECVQTAESASMSCVVSAARKTWTISSATGS